QADGAAGRLAARRADPHPDRDGRVAQGADQLVELGIGHDGAAAVEPEHERQRALALGGPHLVVDVADEHRVEEAVDLDHRHRARPGRASALLGARGWADGGQGRAHGREGEAELRYSPADRPRTGGGRRALWILNCSSLHLGWSRWLGGGGGGKTTVSATLARAAALCGLSTLVVEVEGKSGLPGMFGQGELGYEEVVLAAGGGPDGAADVRARTLTADAALLEYLQDHGLSRVS